MSADRRMTAISLAALVMALSPPALAARLPEWARAVRDNAPPISEDVPKDQTRVLFSETHVIVAKDGTLTTRWRYASQALTTRVSRIATQNQPFREGSRIVSSKAWHLPSGEKAQKSYDPLVDITIDDSFLTDLKARFVSVGGVTRGSIVFFEFEIEDVPTALSHRHLFFEGEATTVERYEVEVPAGWTVRSDWLRRKGPEPVVEGQLWRWEMRDLPAPENEPFAEPAAAAAPLLVVGFTPPAGVKLLPLDLADWRSCGLWYQDVAKGRETVTPEIQAAVKGIAMPTNIGFFQRLRGLAVEVRDTVRYVAKEIGIGSYQPRPAAEVLRQRYGDCKDKATLLRSILAASGFSSYPLLINATTATTISETIASPDAFNHFVVAVALPGEAVVPPEFLPATLELPDFGRLLIIDVTDPYNSIGYLPLNLQGKTGLLVAGDRSRLITLPESDASVHRVIRRFRTEVHEDRSLAVEVSTRLYGDPAESARTDYRRSSLDRRKRVESSFLETFIRAVPKSYSAEVEAADGAFVETMLWSVPPPPAGAPPEVPVFVGSEMFVPRTSLSKRKTAVVYSYPTTVRSEAIVTGLPASVSIPEPDDRRGAGWSVSFQCRREESAITGTWEMILSKPRFEPEAMGELRKFWQAVSATGKVAIPL